MSTLYSDHWMFDLGARAPVSPQGLPDDLSTPAGSIVLGKPPEVRARSTASHRGKPLQNDLKKQIQKSGPGKQCFKTPLYNII